MLSDFERPFLTAFSDGDPGTAGWDAVFQERVPGTQGQPHTTITGAGHFLQEEKGPECAQAMIAFMQKHPA